MTHPYSRHRLHAFDIAELPKDVNGQPDGHKYEPFQDFADMHAYRNVVGAINGIWSGRIHKLASMDEFDIFVVLEGNPQVISIREGYVICPPDVIEDILKGEPVHKNRVMTIDFVLTLRARNLFGPLRYLGLSSKPARLANLESGKRRASKEGTKLAQIGWGWDYALVPSKQKVANHVKLRQWAKGSCLDDAARDAAQLAAMFYNSTSNKGLERQLAMFGKRLGIASEDQFFIFAGAYYLGYLALDHEHKLDEGLPPILKRPARTASGWLSNGR